MKTRSNMPLFVLEVSDVKALSNSQINLLRCGDWLVKKDSSGEHPYQVTFKKEGVGMCLTYHDASVIETQSYDWNGSQHKWVYNSEDKSELPVGGDLHLSGDLEVDGDAKLFENIVDKDGHKRFIEGDITTDTEHFTLLYGKWSLSGTHLMIVLAGDVEEGVASYVDVNITNLPNWVMNKIIPISGSYVVNDFFGQYKDDGSRVSRQLLLTKHTGYIKIRLNSISTDVSSYSHFRGQVDLLIDNE